MTFLPIPFWGLFGWATLPAMALLTFLLAGVENIGVQIEEPHRCVCRLWKAALLCLPALAAGGCMDYAACGKYEVLAKHLSPWPCRVLPLNGICATGVRALGRMMEDWHGASELAAAAAAAPPPLGPAGGSGLSSSSGAWGDSRGGMAREQPVAVMRHSGMPQATCNGGAWEMHSPSTPPAAAMGFEVAVSGPSDSSAGPRTPGALA